MGKIGLAATRGQLGKSNINALTAPPSSRPATTSDTECTPMITRDIPINSASRNPAPMTTPRHPRDSCGTRKMPNSRGYTADANTACPEIPMKSSAGYPTPQPIKAIFVMVVSAMAAPRDTIHHTASRRVSPLRSKTRAANNADGKTICASPRRENRIQKESEAESTVITGIWKLYPPVASAPSALSSAAASRGTQLGMIASERNIHHWRRLA